ncbi:hypothetical protein PGT21_018804 [Puccinia graminis f. sp. tritici]|nr:hypothetical protein PGT21_018804 [Puccinia graminis f. sp. tritici]KAA1129431.1 hypothetical protein PGTUg99_034386 [Puccinia graminis f. sp. tritici]
MAQATQPPVDSEDRRSSPLKSADQTRVHLKPYNNHHHFVEAGSEPRTASQLLSAYHPPPTSEPNTVIGSPISPLPPHHFSLHQVHQDIVASLPAGTHSLGTMANCGIHSFVKMDPSFDLNRPLSSISSDLKDGLNNHVRLLCLQGHPKFTYDILPDSLSAQAKNGYASSNSPS